MVTRAATEHKGLWMALRVKLWPPIDGDDFNTEMDRIIESPDQEAFLCWKDSACVGFLEMSIRNFADGCVTDRVAYVEGIYVEPPHRQQRIGLQLLKRGEQWAREKGCTEMASDVEIGNNSSMAFHTKAGFTEVTRAVLFARKL
jgi:aminoglycoside 6'-N-acetyltransferase I